MVVEENDEATIPATFSKTSDAYDFRVFAGEKEIKSFAKGEALIGIPYAYSSKSSLLMRMMPLEKTGRLVQQAKAKDTSSMMGSSCFF